MRASWLGTWLITCLGGERVKSQVRTEPSHPNVTPRTLKSKMGYFLKLWGVNFCLRYIYIYLYTIGGKYSISRLDSVVYCKFTSCNSRTSKIVHASQEWPTILKTSLDGAHTPWFSLPLLSLPNELYYPTDSYRQAFVQISESTWLRCELRGVSQREQRDHPLSRPETEEQQLQSSKENMWPQNPVVIKNDSW